MSNKKVWLITAEHLVAASAELDSSYLHDINFGAASPSILVVGG